MGIMTMSKPTPETLQRIQGFEKAAAASQGESLLERILGVSGPEQEVVAVADRDRHAVPGQADAALGYGRDAVHLHLVLTCDAAAPIAGSWHAAGSTRRKVDGAASSLGLTLVGDGRGGHGDGLGVAEVVMAQSA